MDPRCQEEIQSMRIARDYACMAAEVDKAMVLLIQPDPSSGDLFEVSR